MDKLKYCRYCRAKDITPIEVTTRRGSSTQTALLCPRCGEIMGAKWPKKKKKEDK